MPSYDNVRVSRPVPQQQRDREKTVVSLYLDMLYICARLQALLSHKQTVTSVRYSTFETVNNTLINLQEEEGEEKC